MAQKSAGAARWFADAFRQHQAGQWREAEAGYRRVLSAQPRHAKCLYLLGSLLAQQGEFEQALAPLAQAVALEPGLAEAHNNMGIALKEMGRAQEAVGAYDQALQARPDYAEAANNKGIALQSQGRQEEALACFAQAVTAKPSYTEAWNNQGIALNTLGRPGDAARCFAEAVALEPGSARAHNNLGNALMEQSQFSDALSAYDRALAIDGANAEVHSNRGTALKELSRFDEARAALARALQIRPAYPDALSNLATCLLAEGRTADALEAYGLALALDPQHRDAHWNRALALLISGDWANGWAEYEWRFHKFAAPCTSTAPRWDGVRLDGKTILVCAEQGAGDTLKFVRFLPLVQAMGGRVVFACPPALHTLMASCAGIDSLVAPHETVPHDVWVPLLSLPGLFGTTPKTVPQNTPYLSAPLGLADAWRAKINSAAPDTVKVGICWAGSPDQKNDHNRSARLLDFAPLADVPGVTFFSLQKGESAAQTAAPPPGMTLVDLTPSIHDFADTAALMGGLDLIVTVDTSVAHLAGALGLPVWTLLPHAAPWHYLHGRADSPWYPTMRLFQQTTPRDWAPVFAQVTATLLAAVAAPLCANLIADGEAAYAGGDLAQARDCFAQALEIDPAQARALSNLAVLDYADGRYEAALAWLERALAIDPTDDAALANKALCLQALHRDAHAAQFQPRVSVVVPCYKQAHLLPEAVASVVAQTYTHWELIVVNDGSPDNTIAVAQELIARYPQCAIRLVERANGGLSAARNTGIRASAGQFILPLDADDTLHPTMLAKTVAALLSHPADAVAYTHVQHFGTQHDIWHAGPFTPDAMAEANRLVCSALYKREVFEAVGGYSEDMPAYEDWNFWLSALEQGYTGRLVPEALFQYRKAATSMLTDADTRRANLTAHIVTRHPALYSLGHRMRAARLLKLPPPADAKVSVSVVVPCYKQAHLLPEAVASVVAQTYQNWELIVVNDGSPDNTCAVAEELIARYPECVIRLIDKPNAGVGAARNTGMAAAAGQYILPLDADDKLHPDMLAKTVALLESQPEAAICYTDVQMFGTQDRTWLCGPLTLDHSRLENTVAHCCLFRREVFQAVGGYSTLPGYEDWKFWLDALDKGFGAVHLPEPLFLYRQWAQSKFTQDSKKHHRFVAEIVLRHPHLYHPSRLQEAKDTLVLPTTAPQAKVSVWADDAEGSGRQRVLLAMNWFFPHVGGEEKLSEDIGAALLKAGFEVEVATRYLADRTQHTHRGMRIHSLSGNVADEFGALVQARQPHAVVVIGGPEIEFLPAAAQLPASGPRLIIVPCIKPDSYKDVHAIPALRKALEAAAQRAEVTVTSSRYGYDARLFADLGIDSVYVPNAVQDTEAQGDFRARYGIPKDTRLLVDVSNMRREKNHAGLLRHLRDLPGDWHLVLIGCRFEPTPHVATHVAHLAAQDPRVTIVPGAPPALIAAALEEADLLLLPSLADATPLVLLEAMSHGLPWIATPECGSAHDHAGGLMLPLPRFGQAIDFLLNDADARAALAQAGRAHWQACYTYDVIGPRYAALVSGAQDVPDLQAPAQALAQTEAVRALFAAQPVPQAADTDIAVSVVITIHHAHRPLGKILDAYAAQTLAPSFFEVIVIDARPAGSPALAIDSAKHPFSLTTIRQDTARGEGFARNAALLRARGEIVVLMTDTLLPAPDYLEQHLRQHQKYAAPHVGVLGRIADPTDTARSVTRFVLTHTDGLEINFDAFGREEGADARALAAHGVSLKRAFLLERGLYSPTSGAQMHAELGWRLKDDGLHFCHCPQAVAHDILPVSFDEYCARQAALGCAAAHLARAEASPYLLFWLGVFNAEDRLQALDISAQAAGQVGAQLAALDKAGLGTVEKRPDFLPALVPALGRLCRLEAERRLLTAYLQERDALIAQDDASPAPLLHGPKVSVVIPCYNYARYLPGAVGSLVAQTYANWEAVIVDDGSPDDTAAVAQALVDAHPDHAIRLVSQPNTGHPSFARNRGIRETDGAYILCLDADDEIAPTFLAECVGLLERETSLSLAYTDQWRFTDDGQGATFHCGDWHPADLSQYLPLGVCTLFRRQAWTDAGGWRAVGYEDWDFWLACAEAGHQGLRIPKPLYRYRKHGIGKYEADKSQGFVNKAWLALNHPALHDDNRRRWAWGVVEADNWLAAPAASAPPQAVVSVILTAMDSSPLGLEQAVQSVRAQTYPHLELVVAGPGAAHVRHLPGIVIADAASKSISADAARVHALNRATGKYVAYLDGDAQWTPEHLATLVGFLDNTRYQAAYADTRLPGTPAPAAGFDSLQLLAHNTVPLCGLVHARACLAQTGSFDLSLPALADWEFVLRLSRFFDLAHLRIASVLPAVSRRAAEPAVQEQAMRAIYDRYRALTQHIPVLRAQQQAALDAVSRPSAPPKPIILTATVCRERKMDLYAPCPCGSGKKLKFCHYNQPANPDWLLGDRPTASQPRSLVAA